MEGVALCEDFPDPPAQDASWPAPLPETRPAPHSVEQAAVSGPWDVRFTPVAPAVTQLNWSALIRVPAAVRSRPTSVLL